MDLKDPSFGLGGKAELPPEGARENGFPLRPEVEGGKGGFIWASHAELASEGGREGNLPLRAELGGKNFRPEMCGEQTSPVELPADLPESPYIGNIKRPDPVELRDGEEIKSPWIIRAKAITEASERQSFNDESTPRKKLIRRIPVPDRTGDQKTLCREACRTSEDEFPRNWI